MAPLAVLAGMIASPLPHVQAGGSPSETPSERGKAPAAARTSPETPPPGRAAPRRAPALEVNASKPHGKAPPRRAHPRPGSAAPGSELGRCDGITLPERHGDFAFKPGEELAYELTVAGVSIGRFETKVGRPRTVDGRQALSLFGRARTNSFASTFKRFAGRYMTLVDPGSLRPLGVRAESTYGDDRRWERTRFSNGHRSVTSSFLYQGKEGQRSYDGGDPVTDILTMLYFARTRELEMGAEVCQEVFGGRWLWRMDARVRGVALVATPAGEKEAIWVSTTFRRSPHPDVKPGLLQPIEMDVYFAKDSTQAPLAFLVRQDKVAAEGKLVSWSLESGDERAWEF